MFLFYCCRYFIYDYGLVVTIMLCFLPLCYHVLFASITFILAMLGSSTCWVRYVLRCMTTVGYQVPVICIVPWC